MKSLKLLILLFFMIQLFLTHVYSQKDPNCGGVNDPCVLANSTMEPCNGYVAPVTPEALSGAEPFRYMISTINGK